MKFKKAIVSFLIMILITVIGIQSFADVGGHQRYSSGSSSSSSSSSSRRSSSSSYSGGSSSYSSSSRKTSSSPGNPIAALLGLFMLFVVIAAVVILRRALGKNGLTNNYNYNNNNNNYPNNLINNTQAVEEQIKQIDPMFSSEKFLSWSKELFIKLQAAWTKREWQGIRPFESNELFAQHNAQLQEFIENGRTNIVERVAVSDAQLLSFTQDGDKELLTITLKAVMRDYIIDDKTQAVLEGNKYQDMYMTYKLTFMRKAGVKTKEGVSNVSTTNCPNCAAPTQITSAGQCEFCGSIITTGEHDWVLSNLEGI